MMIVTLVRKLLWIVCFASTGWYNSAAQAQSETAQPRLFVLPIVDFTGDNLADIPVLMHYNNLDILHILSWHQGTLVDVSDGVLSARYQTGVPLWEPINRDDDSAMEIR